MKNLLYALLALALLSCGEKSATRPANLLTSNDFESLDGWMNGANVPSLTKERAHSGVFSIKVDPGIDYSLNYNNQLGKLSASRVRKIRLHGWVFLPNDKAAVSLVTEIKNPGEAKDLLWDGTDLLKAAQEKSAFNQWFEIDRVIDVPESATYTSQLVVYLWRGGSTQPAYLDDLQIFKVD